MVGSLTGVVACKKVTEACIW